MADQTNAEVSDERLRDCPFCGGANIFVQNAGWQANTFMRCPDCRTTFSLDNGTPRSHADTVAAWNRRSVTSQASEGAGWKLVPVEPTEEMYGPKDAPTSFAHFIRFGDFCHSYKAMLAAAPAASPSKRVERLETALRPFADCVFNDNGDMTISGTAKPKDFVRAYFAIHRPLQGGPLMTTLDTRAQAIWDAVEARIDAAPIDGISAEGQYSETVFNGQRLYVDGLRAGRLAAINALSSLPAQAVGVKLVPVEKLTPEMRAAAETAARKINPGRSEDHIKSVALDGLSIYRAIVAAAPSQPAAVGALEAAARDLVASRSESYRAGNNRQVSLQDQDGEKMWIVPFDEMAALEAALRSTP